MASGSRGLYGQAVLKPVEGGVSRGTGFVMGPFLEGNLVLEKERKSAAVVKRDAQVSAQKQRLLYHQYSITLLSSTETCAAQNGFDLCCITFT